jgi:hypothetical protein
VSKPTFIVTRFTHGSAGKFLSTVLQTSKNVDHWSTIVQKQKEINEFVDEVTLQYVNRSFPKEHAYHMQFEPMVPYCCDLYSPSYPRGQQVTIQQYRDYALKVNDTRLESCLNKNLIANLIFHKPQISDFCSRAKVVTILVQTELERKWLHNTLWSKHFLEKDNNIYYLPNAPDYCSFSSLSTILKFQNKYKFASNEKEELFDKYVINDHTNSWYNDPSKFTKFDKSKQLDNHFINLADFFDVGKFILAMTNIFEYFNLGNVDQSLVTKMHNIWWTRQITP